MRNSIYTEIVELIKRSFGISDISMLKKNIRKHIGMLLYHEKYNADDIVSVLKQLGVKPGDVVCIHAAMKEFYNYKGTAEELVTKIIEYLTPEGTLLMPAFVSYDQQRSSEYIFDSAKDKTAAGYLAEVFRQYPGVQRSINVRHSVCVFGKYAKELTDGHESCINCWDENSPWYKMTRLDAVVVNFGLSSHYIGTFDHCVEGILYKEHPYWRQFFNLTRTFKYYDQNRQVKSYTCLDGYIDTRSHEMTLIKHFDETMHRSKKLSNLLINVYYSRPCLDKMLELGRKGISMYYVPSPSKYTF